MIIEEHVLMEDDWRGKITSKHDEKTQKELCLKLFVKEKKSEKVNQLQKSIKDQRKLQLSLA